MTDDEAVADAKRILESGMQVEIARALGMFRTELAEWSVIDSDEAGMYGQDYLQHLLAAWLPTVGEASE